MEISKAIDYFMSALTYEEVSEHTLRAYKQDLDQWAHYIPKEMLDTLTFEDFQDYFMYLQSLKLKTASLKRKRVVLHRFLKFCSTKKLCLEKLHTYIDPIKSKKTITPKEVLTQEEIQVLFDFVQEEKNTYFSKQGTEYYDYLYYCSIRNELILKVLLYTGCRAQELVTIKKQGIVLQRNTITILAKGHKYNEVPIHEKLIEALENYKQAIEQMNSKTLIESLEKSIYLFPSKGYEEEHLSTRALHDLMKRFSVLLKRPIHAHLFRHTFASYCIAAHMDIATLSTLVSHSNPSITLSIYTHEIQGTQKQQEIKKLKFDL